MQACTYMPWGELDCIHSNSGTIERFIDGAPVVQEEELEQAYDQGEGLHSIINLIDPSYVPAMPFVILFEERPKIKREDNGAYIPPYYGKWVILPYGYHKSLGNWNDRARAMFIARGTKVSLFDKPNGDGIISTHTVPKSGRAFVVDLTTSNYTLSSMKVEGAH